MSVRKVKTLDPTLAGAPEVKLDIQDSNANEELEEQIFVMEQHRRECEQSGFYEQAETARESVAELKEQLFARQKEDMLILQQQQKEECEFAHKKMLKEFKIHWKNTLKEQKAQDQQTILALQQDQELKLAQNKKDLEEKLINAGYKHSSHLLDERKKQSVLAKQKKYTEAHEIQIWATKQEEKEYQAFLEEVGRKVYKAESQWIKVQKIEMSSLTKKISTNINELIKQRDIEQNLLLKRYFNVNQDIDNLQTLERKRHELKYKVRPESARSNTSMMSSTYGSSLNNSTFGSSMMQSFMSMSPTFKKGRANSSLNSPAKLSAQGSPKRRTQKSGESQTGLLEGYDPKQHKGKWINFQDNLNHFMRNPRKTDYRTLLANGHWAFTKDLIEVWAREKTTKAFFQKYEMKVPHSHDLEYQGMQGQEWTEDFRKEVYYLLKNFIDKQDQLYEAKNKNL